MDDNQEEIEASPHWLRASEESRERVLQALERDQWRPEIERTKSVPSLADERLWCDTERFEKLVQIKKVVNKHDPHAIEEARKRSNPHEPLLDNKLMIGRYSLLLSSIDRVSDFLLTQENVEDAVTKRPLDTRPRGENIDRDAELFYFAESQTLPLPFASQYVWVRKGFYNAKCFSPQFCPASPLCGLASQAFLDTIKRVAYKKLDDQFRDESCNPYDPAVREVFMDMILKGTRGEGVHLYAGFTHNLTHFKENYGDEPAKDNEEAAPIITDVVKELLFRDSYVGQLLYATRIVRKGGKAILHFLDTNTSLSMAVLYLAHIIFDRVSIYKPNMSRPANSERFLICDGLRTREAKAVRKYIEESLEKVRDKESLIRLIPDRTMDDDANFLHYTTHANNQLAERQTKFLESYDTMLNDAQKENLHQKECLDKCLPYYLIPYATKEEMSNFVVEMKKRTAMDILTAWIPDGIKSAELLLRSLSSNNVKMNQQLFKEKMDSNTRLFVTPCSDSSSTLIVATNNNLEFWSGVRKEWIDLSRYSMILPTDTVLIGDVIETKDSRTLIVRILDVGVIFGDDISSLPFKKRLQAAEKMVEATRKDGAKVDVIFTLAQYEEADKGFNPKSIGDRVVENEIYFMKKRIRIVEESDVPFYKMAYGERVWEI